MNAIDIIKELGSIITVTDIIVYLLGLTLFVTWLLKTSLGRKALADSIPRRNNMPPYIPVLFLVVWIILTALGRVITVWFSDSKGLAKWQGELLSYTSMGVLEILLIFVMVFMGWLFFAKRLRGFGFKVRTVGKDLVVAVMNLIAILPIVSSLIILVSFSGRLLSGDDFQMQQNEGLKTVITYPQLSVRVMVFIFAAGIVPVFEEIMFRGLFQTMVRSIVPRAWVAVVFTSFLFALLHPWTHWPALFALSMCLGYAYEKSGSLFRPIFIHSFFNAIAIIAALNQ